MKEDVRATQISRRQLLTVGALAVVAPAAFMTTTAKPAVAETPTRAYGYGYTGGY